MEIYKMRFLLLLHFMLFILDAGIISGIKKYWFFNHDMSCRYCLKNTFNMRGILRQMVGNKVIIKLDVKNEKCVLDERFLSFSVDTIEMKRHFRCLPLTAQKINILAKGLSPAYLRLGGTAQDFLTFVENGNQRKYHKTNFEEEFESMTVNCTPKFENYSTMKPFNITMKYFELTADFAERNNLQLIYGLNARKRYSNSSWNEENALKLINFASSRRFKINWELGNEANRYNKYGTRSVVSGLQLAKDFKTLWRIVNDNPIFGPDVTQPSYKALKYMKMFFRNHPPVNAVTYHQYYMHQTKSTVAKFLDPAYLEKLDEQMKWVRQLMSKMNMTMDVWLGESGSSSGGGARNLSDTYAAGFLYLGKLGLASENCHQVVIRQSFYGGYYSMLDPITHEPLPDYWSSLLFKRLVGKIVLYLKADNNSYVKTFAFCSNIDPDDMVVMVINFHRDVAVQLSLKRYEKNPVEKYLLTAPGNNLQSKHVLLNGKTLKLKNNFELPKTEGILTKMPVRISAASYGFLVIKGAYVHECRGSEQ